MKSETYIKKQKSSQQDFQLKQEIFFLIGHIRDPEKQYQTLESLGSPLTYIGIVTPQSITIFNLDGNNHIQNQKQKQKNIHSYKKILIQIIPTVPYCHLTQQIGLLIRQFVRQFIRYQLKNQLQSSQKYKIHIRCKQGTHNDHMQVQKQINDKERIQAAMEKEDIKQFLQKLCKIQ